MAKLVRTREQFREMVMLEGVDGNIYTIISASRYDREQLVVFKLIAENEQYVILEEQETL